VIINSSKRTAMDLPTEHHGIDIVNIITSYIPPRTLVEYKPHKIILYYRGHRVTISVWATGSGIDLSLKFALIRGGRYPSEFIICVGIGTKHHAAILNGTQMSWPQRVRMNVSMRPFRCDRELIISLYMNLDDGFLTG
jgi:hypothetical protein